MYREMFSSSLKSSSGEGIDPTNRAAEGVQPNGATHQMKSQPERDFVQPQLVPN